MFGFFKKKKPVVAETSVQPPQEQTVAQVISERLQTTPAALVVFSNNAGGIDAIIINNIPPGEAGLSVPDKLLADIATVSFVQKDSKVEKKNRTESIFYVLGSYIQDVFVSTPASHTPPKPPKSGKK